VGGLKVREVTKQNKIAENKIKNKIAELTRTVAKLSWP